MGAGAPESLLPGWITLVEVTVSLGFCFLIRRAMIVMSRCGMAVERLHWEQKKKWEPR